tara:strand:+ start:112 stop:771 length:660 start_codon:yes stop_codon:yes gene_type:complete
MAYFDTKSGSLEEAIRQAVGGQINEASITTDLDDDPKLFKQIEKMGVRVKKHGKPERGYQEVTLTGPQAKIDAANKKLNLLPEKKKLDPVGKEDGDIDNDGDKDSTDKYLAKRRKAIGKAMKSDKKENYDMGTPENTKSKLDATPGQSSDDWQQQVDTMQKKNASMREALAKMWGVDEGHNPFEKKEEKKEKKETKTMTGKPMTKVEVDPDMKEKKTDK